MHILVANHSHLSAIKVIADHNKPGLGFLSTGLLAEAVDRGNILVAVEDRVIGFCHHYRRLDGWTTVREIAVSQECCGKGIGRQLLQQVEKPFRLKCPVDLESNKFYQHIGLLNVWTEIREGKRSLNIWQTQPDIIFCAGNNRKYGQIAKDAGMLYGTRHDCHPFWKPAMVDINFKKFWRNMLEEPNWKLWTLYLSKIARWSPSMAMVPDYMSPGYKSTMIKMAQQLVECDVERVMMCPKFPGAVEHIPEWCLVSVSVPSGYAGYLPEVAELRGRRVHLLGGSVRQQMELFKEYSKQGITVSSVDGNSFIKAAKFGTYFVDGKLKNEGKHKISTDEAFQRSVDGIMKYWRDNTKID